VFDFRTITVISGGQTGADRAALDFAIAHGMPHGGWCPRDRRAEDGPIGDCYELQETPSRHYSQRTRWNIRDSDATLIVSIKPILTGGTRLTLELARQLGKPALHISREEHDIAAATNSLREFLHRYQVQTLNVAGPRASQAPDVAEYVAEVFAAVFSDDC
jgi:hypothetical protein